MMKQISFDKAVAIDPDMPEWRVWRQYFEAHLGFLPSGIIDAMAKRSKMFLVPTQWPSWFDAAFMEDPHWHPTRKAPQPREPMPASADYATMLARHGRPLGPGEAHTKWAHLVGRHPSDRRSTWTGPTDDVLRARYKAQQTATEAAAE